MPDQSEVAASVATLIEGALYPNGTTQPSVTGDNIQIAGGWPIAADLSAWLGQGGVHISIFQQPNDKIDAVFATDDDWQQSSPTTITRSIRRQTKTFRIGVWASTAAQRDAVAEQVDIALGSAAPLDFSDTTTGNVIYVSSAQLDDEQKAGIYRRDLMYAVRYDTTQTQTATLITATLANLTPGTIAGDSVPAPIASTNPAPI